MTKITRFISRNQVNDMTVHNFVYNGLFGKLTCGDAGYTAEFLSWTEDPGIALCKCSDGKERIIPTFALDGFNCDAYPKQNCENKVLYIGKSCKS